ncbi:hypothetical protein ANCDUO_11803 [Ancylostoma duodenale]|uniref:Protein Wnt n=1 Tax=Ancylostoma duodenale TaxID=51022 RepID=A0A0C2GAH7_9BILA|nr:hypothetical protein ANCDUO_11803 [Ancylostoma duodenale]
MSPSPDFCDADPARGIFGTKGRECNVTSQGVDGCQLVRVSLSISTQVPAKHLVAAVLQPRLRATRVLRGRPVQLQVPLLLSRRVRAVRTTHREALLSVTSTSTAPLH